MTDIPRRFHTAENHSKDEEQAMFAVEVLLNGKPVEGWLGYDLDKQEVYRLRHADGVSEPYTATGTVAVR